LEEEKLTVQVSSKEINNRSKTNICSVLTGFKTVDSKEIFQGLSTVGGQRSEHSSIDSYLQRSDIFAIKVADMTGFLHPTNKSR
jgi:hypothetical protein